MSLKCIAIDDEPMALEIITSFCQRYGNIELTTFNNPLRGMEQVRRSRPDILFLDIEMGDLNGVELARDLPPGTLLIFTTAYAQYALDGFELSAVDFCINLSLTTDLKRLSKRPSNFTNFSSFLPIHPLPMKALP